MQIRLLCEMLRNKMCGFVLTKWKCKNEHIIDKASKEKINGILQMEMWNKQKKNGFRFRQFF